MSITQQRVLKIARLANLELSADDVARYTKDLEEILKYVALLNTVDTKGVEPMAQVLHAGNQTPLREDSPGPSFQQETALQCAPLAGAGHFKVPRVIER